MYKTIADFENTWKHESTTTTRILNALTDESLNQPVANGHRTLGRIAWHIVVTIPEMADNMGLDLPGVAKDAPMPKTAKEFVDAYLGVSRGLLDRIAKDWDDDTFATEVDMYGERWTRGFGIKAMIDHEIHHRGQMTVLMRQAGVVVPSLYGPAKEGWEQMDMEPPVI